LSEKGERIVIRCSLETKRRFRVLAAQLGANYEDTLNWLLDYAPPEPVPARTYGYRKPSRS